VVKRADGVRFAPGTPRERVGHHWIDLARATSCTATGPVRFRR
jgi:hypothetical protein